MAQQGLLQQIQLEDEYRRAQLLADNDSIRHSFAISPFAKRYSSIPIRNKKDTVILSSYAGFTLQNNSGIPYGYNSESLFPAIGAQQRMTLGVHLESKNFSIKIQPEFINATNTLREDLLPPPSNSLNNYWGKFFAMLGNKIDMPSRFGTAPISKSYFGQSAIRYKNEYFSVGVSSENLWWGPARFNALVMSNNAPGFVYGTINTMKPIQTPIGSFEAQIIVGGVKNSNITPPEFDRIAQIGCPQCYEKPLDKTRNINGYIVSFTPKGLKNIYLGMSSVSYGYTDTNIIRARLGSLFFRYAMPKDHAEIYAEYGRSDKMISPFDLLKDSVPYGYTIGFRKLLPSKKNNSYFSLSFELTHLGLSKAHQIFDVNNIWGGPNPKSFSWYTNANIRHGYTNDGRVMGAGIGPGSNSQTLNIAWHQNKNMLGFQVQRVMRNTDFYYYYYFNGNIGDGNTSAFWTDISTSIFAQWQFNNLLVAGSIDMLSSINYKWLKLDGGFADPSSLSDKRNTQIRLSATYAINWRF
jgi:hypothetical protein